MSAEKIDEIRAQIALLRNQLTTLQKVLPTEKVENYQFNTITGAVSLADLFNDKDTLFVIHNMGTSCPYCTLWGDGFNGVLCHLQNRASVVICSPDSPEAQETFRASRQWNFTMVSTEDSSFSEEMGYQNDNGFLPGVSAFKKQGDDIHRVANTAFGPGDDFCAVWHLLDMLPEGAAGWQPKFSYEQDSA